LLKTDSRNPASADHGCALSLTLEFTGRKTGLQVKPASGRDSLAACLTNGLRQHFSGCFPEMIDVGVYALGLAPGITPVFFSSRIAGGFLIP
jgi:hypothetical protein